jgi:hypothetical protein
MEPAGLLDDNTGIYKLKDKVAPFAQAPHHEGV